MHKTTIVVVPRERFSSVVASLGSLFSTVSDNVPVVVVEGGSPAKVISELQKLRKTRYFDLISTAHKITPNEARNIGARLAKSEYIVFSDNDIEYCPGWLNSLEDNADQNSADMVAPLTLIGPSRRPVIHHAGGDLIATNNNGCVRLREIHRLGNADYEDRRASICESAPLDHEICEFHCMLIRKELFSRIGGLDERLITREHMDLALHAKCLGARITFEKDSLVTYLAKNNFTLSDLNYFLFRWSHRLADSSVSAFEGTWGVKVDRDSLLKSSIGRRRHRAVASKYPRLRRLLGERLFRQWVIQPLESLVMRRSLKRRSCLKVRFSPEGPDADVRSRIIDSIVPIDRWRELEEIAFRDRSAPLEERRRIAEDLVEERPDDPRLRYRFARLQNQYGDVEGAISSLRRAMELDPTYAVVHRALGSLYAGQGRIEDAVETFELAVELDPMNYIGHQQLSRLYVRQGRLGDAVEAARKALDLRPDDPGLHNRLGNLLEQQGSVDEAIAAQLRATELGIAGPGMYRKLSGLYAHKGDYGKSLECVYRALISYGHGTFFGSSKSEAHKGV